MESRGQPQEITVSPHARLGKQWQEILAGKELARRFDELVELTQRSVNEAEYSWVADRQAVAMRWQHLIDMLGGTARSHGHPLFENGSGWADKERVAEVLEPIEYRSFDAPFVENALILTHSLAIKQKQSNNPGLSVNLNTLNNKRDNQDPRLINHFTCVFDLRDMAEPTDTVIGDMTVEDFKALNEDQRQELQQKLYNLTFNVDDHGNGYGWLLPPQKDKYYQESKLLVEYTKIIEYGTADGDEIDNIRDQRKADEIALLRQERPDFGKTPDNFEALPDNLKRCVESILIYFDQARDRFETIYIDTYSMGEMGFTEEDLTGLKQAGILVNEEAFMSPGGWLWSYKLAEPYYEYWVSGQYPKDTA